MRLPFVANRSPLDEQGRYRRVIIGPWVSAESYRKVERDCDYNLLMFREATARILTIEEHSKLQQHNLEEMRKAVHRSEETADSWKALYDAERIRNDRLVEKLLTMKQEGFTTAAERQNVTPPQPSKIEDAINEKAGANGALRRHLSRWASQRLAMKISEDEIVDALVKWRDPDENEGAEA